MAQRKIQETIGQWTLPIRHIIHTVGYGILFFFLVMNILFSQQLPSLYFSIINEEAGAMVTFLKYGKDIPAFRLIASEIQDQFLLYGNEIYKEERHRQQLIQKLETLLAQNPQSRDVLYSLYLLYDRSGDEITAQHYFQRAKEIDPGIKQ